jgi:hypothetical protein
MSGRWQANVCGGRASLTPHRRAESAGESCGGHGKGVVQRRCHVRHSHPTLRGAQEASQRPAIPPAQQEHRRYQTTLRLPVPPEPRRTDVYAGRVYGQFRHRRWSRRQQWWHRQLPCWQPRRERWRQRQRLPPAEHAPKRQPQKLPASQPRKLPTKQELLPGLLERGFVSCTAARPRGVSPCGHGPRPRHHQ